MTLLESADVSRISNLESTLDESVMNELLPTISTRKSRKSHQSSPKSKSVDVECQTEECLLPKLP